ncbi:BTB/POZ domain-containing protein 3-like [Sitodiplosis mosellana]|uniref:BTB/POZ domain-containing protein 3-like n=1 Tax=Sitodiplosis mosellana TaxID=263140 RepID=UPI002443B085|nr:BTB/POZ domain-containing protein 3-like [Sitodiplosis mosellana]
MAECMAVCSKFLKNNLNDDNVCQNYELAIIFKQDDLKRLNTNALLKSTGFLSCDQKVLAEILRLNWLSCTEVELFEACMSWVKTTARKDDLTKELVQTQLGAWFYVFRFGSISLGEFSKLIPAYRHLFVSPEYANIIQMIADKEFQATMFNGNREKRSDSEGWKMKNTIYCNRLLSLNYSTEPYFINNLETTKFSSNEPLLLKGFGLDYTREHRDNEYSFCEDVPTEISIVEIAGCYTVKNKCPDLGGISTGRGAQSYILPSKQSFRRNTD